MTQSIQNKLAENKALLESELDRYYRDLPDEAQSLIEAQRYSLLDGGKRIRAFLLLELSRLLGAEPHTAIPYACAVEMIHASSLIHDDMPCMDNDDTRRGKPSTHKAYGEALALLSGDAMMVRAFETAVTNPHLPTQTNAKAVRILAQATGSEGMLAGQTLDTLFADADLTLDKLITVHNLKTGKLISACARLACLASDIDEYDERYISAITYSENIGLAFQIIDDILDFKEGKREMNSFLSFMTLSEAQNYARDLTNEGIDAISKYDDGTLRALAEYLTVREY